VLDVADFTVLWSSDHQNHVIMLVITNVLQKSMAYIIRVKILHHLNKTPATPAQPSMLE
jgi:hypothetical protein